jgi:hypothetical protein
MIMRIGGHSSGLAAIDMSTLIFLTGPRDARLHAAVEGVFKFL